MTIYTHRDSNIRKTWALFSVFLIVVIWLGWIFSQIYGNASILFFAVIFSSLMSIISYWYSDKIVLAMVRARELQKKDAPELYNIVENLTITAGLPMPRLYLVADRAPNAFATGRDPKHAVVAVTAGILEILAGFISLLADFFMRSMWFGGFRRNEDRNGGGALILIGIALSILAPIAATLMQLAISRKREFLADASGALLTRYPEGLARALEKISKVPIPVAHATPTTAHLWFADPLKKKATRLFMTHPPIEERVR